MYFIQKDLRGKRFEALVLNRGEVAALKETGLERKIDNSDVAFFAIIGAADLKRHGWKRVRSYRYPDGPVFPPFVSESVDGAVYLTDHSRDIVRRQVSPESVVGLMIGWIQTPDSFERRVLAFFGLGPDRHLLAVYGGQSSR
ncbi:MAG: hypothetical protein MUC96_26520 [Myxococcaceae bacterium]|nr:hypothetical protein [Myxococcaceae bacterium]